MSEKTFPSQLSFSSQLSVFQYSKVRKQIVPVSRPRQMLLDVVLQLRHVSAPVYGARIFRFFATDVSLVQSQASLILVSFATLVADEGIRAYNSNNVNNARKINSVLPQPCVRSTTNYMPFNFLIFVFVSIGNEKLVYTYLFDSARKITL